MAEQVLMPKQGNSVESCIILEWKKREGDNVSKGEVLCEVESDKAAFEVESHGEGILLKQYFREGDDVPVYAPIAFVGEKGDDIPELPPASTDGPVSGPSSGNSAAEAAKVSGSAMSEGNDGGTPSRGIPESGFAVSPRARELAKSNSLDISSLSGHGSGPGGRIIERDVRALLELMPKSATDSGERYLGAVREYPVQGVRKIVSERMSESLRTTAQLTLHASADARAILAYREKLKSSKKELGLRDISLNDLVFFAAVQAVKRYPALNAHFLGDKIVEYSSVHAAFAVDTERGLTVPVVRFAEKMSLKELSAETARLGGLCIYGGITPDDLTGGTFTVSNLGVLGVEMFTPILNPPQTAILGVCNIQSKPVFSQGETLFYPHIGFSLTVDHQAVDGAPAARYLKSLCESIADFELTLA